MSIIFTYRKIFLTTAFLFMCLGLFSQIPTEYYDGAEGKSGAELKTALHNTIRNHIVLDFDIPARIWWYDYFTRTDWHPDGYFWDMYSKDQKSTYSGGQNREHCMPRSWWSTSDYYSSFDANGDLHNLQPANADANTAKSNYPLGIVRAGTEIFNNGVVKVGTSSFPGYTREVFEPADEYKGDFARTYMYMVTCYEDYYENWRSLGIQSMLQRNTHPTFSAYAINLLMEWHNNDPVSEKEIDRNNAVFEIQNNRNPFIDYPNFARLIWTPDIRTNLSLTLYPNPAANYLILEFNETEFENYNYNIYSINGILMQQQEISVGSQIFINTLNDGLYLIVVYAGNQRITEKFIVNRSLAN